MSFAQPKRLFPCFHAATLLLCALVASATQMLAQAPISTPTPTPAQQQHLPGGTVPMTPSTQAPPSVPAPAVPTPAPHAAVHAADAPDYSNEPLVVEQNATICHYNADGTGDRTMRAVFRLQSEAAVRQFGVLLFPYAADNETIELHYVRVRKPDGTVLATDKAAGQDMPAAVTQQAPLYSDLRQLQVPVRSLAVGDRIEYEAVVHLRKAEAPGEFWNAFYFEPSAISLNETIELRYPSSRNVTVLSPSYKAERSTEGAETVYRWHASQTVPTVAAPGASPLKTTATLKPKLVPDVAWTTFKDWAAVGTWYRDLAAARAVPDEALKAKAASLIAGAGTDDEKIDRLYSFIAMQIRYIGVDFGIGRIQPHAASAVLANGYGDCKDKHTLLEALLAAAGFHADPVLIGAGIHFDKDLPSPLNFNHVITAVERPGGKRLWLDATAEVAPPGMLIAALRDEEALLIPPAAEGAPLLVKTPATPPFPVFDRCEARGTLLADGSVKAHFTLTLRGDIELAMRSALFASSRAQWEQLGQGLSGGLGFGGKVTDFQPGSIDDLSQPLTLQYDYGRDNYGDWPNHRTLALLPGNLFAEPELTEQPDEPVALGAPRLETARSTLVLPEGYTAELPPDVHIKASFASFDVTSSLHGRELITEEKLQIDATSVPVDKWQELGAFAKDISANSGNYIALTESHAPNSPTNPASTQASAQPSAQPGARPGARPGAQPALAEPVKTPASAPVVADTRAQLLVEQARTLIQSSQYPEAQAKLDEARTLNPQEEGLWYSLGDIATKQHRYPEAELDIQKELSLVASDRPAWQFDVLSYLLWLQTQRKEDSLIIDTLASMYKLHPEQTALLRREAGLLVAAGRYEEAISLLEGAALRNPADKYTLLALGNAQLAAGRLREGQTTLETLLESTEDPEIVNSAAYRLADHQLDLPADTVAAQKALRLLEKQTAETQLSKLEAKDLGQQNLLAALWDTVGWIDYLQGDLDAAEDYIHAAWLNAEHTEVGYHLGMVYEKQNKPQLALAVYSLAYGTRADTVQSSPMLEALRQRRAALLASGLKGSPPQETSTRLAELRSLHLPLPANEKMEKTKEHQEADFLIATSGHTPATVNFLEGSALLRGESEAVRKALEADHANLILPKNSSAQLIRRGILSCWPDLGKCDFVFFLPQDTRLPKSSSQAIGPAPAEPSTDSSSARE